MHVACVASAKGGGNLFTRSVGTTVVGGRNMQMPYLIRWKQISLSTADRLITNFRNGIVTPEFTFHSQNIIYVTELNAKSYRP